MQTPTTQGPVGSPVVDWAAFQQRSKARQLPAHLLTARAIGNDDIRANYEGKLPLDDPRIIEALGGYAALSNPAAQGLISAFLDARRQQGGGAALDSAYDTYGQLVAGDDAAIAATNDDILAYLQSEEGRSNLRRAQALGLEQGAPRANQDDWLDRVLGMTDERANELIANADTRNALLGRFNALQDVAGETIDPADIATRMQRGVFSLTPQWDATGATGFLASLNNIGRGDPAELERLVGIAERAKAGDRAAQDEWLQWTGATTGRMDPTLTLDEVRQYGTRQQVTDFQRKQREEAGMPAPTGPNRFEAARNWWQQLSGPGGAGRLMDNGLGRRPASPLSWISGTTEYDAEGNVTYNAQRSDPFGAFTTWGMPRAQVQQQVQGMQPFVNQFAQGARGAFQRRATPAAPMPSSTWSRPTTAY